MSKKRGNSNFVAIRVSISKALGVLADSTMLLESIIDSIDTDLYVISADLYWSLLQHTAGEGPIMFGLAHGDYSVAEVDEWYESNSEDFNNKIAQEQNKRQCRQAGQFAGLGTDEVLNDGKSVRTKIKFRVNAAQALNIWIRNESVNAMTTGARVNVNGTIYARKL